MTQVDGGGLPAGTQLNGIYEVERRIAIGGMGEVYIGRLIQTGDRVAIKMILPEHANNELILDLFRREASTLHNLYHEAIVRYYVFSVDPVLKRPYLTMEYADGPSLADRLREAPLKEARLTVLRRRVAGGLHAAHKLGIIHRDISPDNIILVDGQVEKAKIIDFGIAKSSGNEGDADRLGLRRQTQLRLARAAGARGRRGHGEIRHLLARPRLRAGGDGQAAADGRHPGRGDRKAPRRARSRRRARLDPAADRIHGPAGSGQPSRRHAGGRRLGSRSPPRRWPRPRRAAAAPRRPTRAIGGTSRRPPSPRGACVGSGSAWARAASPPPPSRPSS